jgi:hypothetical protein
MIRRALGSKDNQCSISAEEFEHGTFPLRIMDQCSCYFEITPSPQPFSSSQRITGFASTVEISHDKVGLLIGSGGNTVRKLEEALHVQLDIPKEPREEGTTPRIAVIRGMPAAVSNAFVASRTQGPDGTAHVSFFYVALPTGFVGKAPHYRVTEATRA